jgi:hypothetical protein
MFVFKTRWATRGVVNQSLGLDPGTNPTIVSFYSATGSPACFENKHILFYFEKCSSLLLRWRCSCKFKSHRIGSRVTRLGEYFDIKQLLSFYLIFFGTFITSNEVAQFTLPSRKPRGNIAALLCGCVRFIPK